MTKSEMFKAAHEQTKVDMRAFGSMIYKEAFGRSLKGLYAALAGYTGNFVR